MGIDLNRDSITDEVRAAFSDCRDERSTRVLTSLVQHLHDFVRDVDLTGEEWFTAIDFLERIGKVSSPTRQEYVLLSDVLGLSVLVDTLDVGSGSTATASTLLGPFFVEGRPTVDSGADISGGVAGTPLLVQGRVVDLDGRPIADAHVDVWHSDGAGVYDVQMPDRPADEFAMRGLLRTDADGRFWFRSIVPRFYPIPTDGPVGELLREAQRSPMRPEHVHFRFHADGFDPLITMLFRDGDPYLENDAVFGVKRELVASFVEHGPGTAPDGSTVDEPFQTLEWTFTLAPARDAVADGGPSA